MTDGERWWFRRVLLAEDVPGLFDDEEEWRVPADATAADALAAYWSEIAVIDGHLATADMDDRMWSGGCGGVRAVGCRFEVRTVPGHRPGLAEHDDRQPGEACDAVRARQVGP
jgi:hypothetical protein